MAYTFKRGCKVVIGYEKKLYVFDNIIDFSHSQRFDRQVVPLKTARRRFTRNKIVTNKVNEGSFNLEVPLYEPEVAAGSERVLFEMLPLDSFNGNVFTLPDLLPSKPKMCTIAILHDNEYYLLKNACITSLDISMSKAAPSIKASFTFAIQEKTDDKGIVSTSDVVTQTKRLRARPVSFARAKRESDKLLAYPEGYYHSIIGIGINIQQSITWEDPRNAYNTDKLNYPSIATLDDFSIGITADLYKKKLKMPDKPYVASFLAAQGSFEVLMRDVMVIPNIQSDTVYKQNLDISVTDVTDITIKLGERYA